MNRLTMIGAALLMGVAAAMAQTEWHSADNLPLYGKVVENTYTRYSRLPADLKDVVRPPVWDLGLNSAGMQVRFRSNSSAISVKWESNSNFSMNHMTNRGINGVDLYMLADDGTWKFLNSGQVNEEAKGEKVMMGNMEAIEREYTLYLALYNGIKSLEIGVDPGATFELPKPETLLQGKPIVYYGTSITQGGCASRPGMAHTNILSRKLNREIVNLGFSGNGMLDLELAELMAKADPSLYVIDAMPNCNAEIVHERFARFVAILREAHPDVPILVIENPLFNQWYVDKKMAEEVSSKNIALREEYAALPSHKGMMLVALGMQSGEDWEGTVDMWHYTDLGFTRYAETLYPIIKSLLLRSEERKVKSECSASHSHPYGFTLHSSLFTLHS